MGDVDGSSQYVRQALGPITPRACANGAESAILKFMFTRKGNSGKKDQLLRSGLEPGSMHCRPLPLPPRMGLWQLWTAKLALILLTAGPVESIMSHGTAHISY